MPQTSTLAKIFGWIQFGLQAASQVASSPTGLPHGAFGWLSLLGSLAGAIGIHHASNTGGPATTNVRHL